SGVTMVGAPGTTLNETQRASDSPPAFDCVAPTVHSPKPSSTSTDQVPSSATVVVPSASPCSETSAPGSPVPVIDVTASVVVRSSSGEVMPGASGAGTGGVSLVVTVVLTVSETLTPCFAVSLMSKEPACFGAGNEK